MQRSTSYSHGDLWLIWVRIGLHWRSGCWSFAIYGPVAPWRKGFRVIPLVMCPVVKCGYLTPTVIQWKEITNTFFFEKKHVVWALMVIE